MFSTTVTEGTRLGAPVCGQGCLGMVWMSKPLDGNPVCPPPPIDALQNYTSGNLTVTGPKETASIFATYPAPYLSLNNGFLDQVGVRGRPGSLNCCSVQWDPNLSFRLWVGCSARFLFAPSPTPAACVGQSADMGR